MGPIFELIFLLVMIYWVIKAIFKFGKPVEEQPKSTAGVRIPYNPIEEETESFSFPHKLSSDEFIREAKGIRMRQQSYDIFKKENASMSEYINVDPFSYERIICYHTDKKTGVTTQEVIKTEKYFFILFSPDELLSLIRRTFGNHPCVSRRLREEESASIRETFRIAKEKSGNLVDWLEDDAEIRNPENYSPHKRLNFPYSETYERYGSDYSEKDIIVIMNHSFWENEERTALITVRSDDCFKAKVSAGCYDGINFSLRTDTVDLPEEFYTYCFIGPEACTSPDSVKEAFERLPGLSVYSIKEKESVKDSFIRLSADRTILSSDTVLRSFRGVKENDDVMLWIEVNGNEKEWLSLSWDWFYAYDVNDLCDLLRKEYPELSAVSEEHMKKVLSESSGITKLFEKAERNVSDILKEDEYARSKELREVLRNVTAYRDSYGDYFNRNAYDRFEGNARRYNYLKVNRGFTVKEAVEQYLRAAEVYTSMKSEGCDNPSYGLMKLGARAFNFDDTIVMTENSDMIPAMEEEFLEQCRQNKIMILEMKGNIYHDHVNGDDYRFEEKAYVEPDHDVTSVFEKNLIKIKRED